MLALMIATIVCLALALAVLALVAVPARRTGRDLLTPKGEEVVELVRETTAERTSSLVGSGRQRHQR